MALSSVSANVITLIPVLLLDSEETYHQYRPMKTTSNESSKGFPGGSMVKKLPGKQEMWFDPWVGKISWRRKWQPTPVFLPGKSQVQRSLAGYSPWDRRRVRHNLVTKQQ